MEQKPQIIKEKRERRRPYNPPPALICVRCPSCLKLFSVNETHILETRPEFSCKSCQTLFWIPYPECRREKISMGIPSHPATLSQKESLKILQKNNSKNKVQSLPTHLCPKCYAFYQWGDKDCARCGLVFDKFNRIKKTGKLVPRSKEVKQMWNNILKDYENEELHQQFLKICRSENHFSYAASQYQNLLKVHSKDPIANKFIKQIQALSSLPLIQKNSLRNKLSKKKRLLPWNFLLLSLSLSFIVTGFVIPPLINFVGIGTSLMFFSLAIRYYFQRIL